MCVPCLLASLHGTIEIKRHLLSSVKKNKVQVPTTKTRRLGVAVYDAATDAAIAAFADAAALLVARDSEIEL